MNKIIKDSETTNEKLSCRSEVVGFRDKLNTMTEKYLDRLKRLP